MLENKKRPNRIMKIIFSLVIVFMIGTSDLFARDLPSYCEDDASYREQLRGVGPIIAVGASGSSGLMAKSFPLLAANQLCLTQGNGFKSHFLFSFGRKHTFLKKQYARLKPKIVIAVDYLHHASKSRKFDSKTRAFIDKEIALLTLDCNHLEIDCSLDGDHHFAVTEGYKPVVILGDIYAFYAVDCTKTDPFAPQVRRHKDPEMESVAAKGCIDDYDRINEYIRQKASEMPNLVIFSVDGFFRNLNQGLPFLYDLDGQLGNFYTNDLFWDGFHPWSEPGSQVFANLVLEKINEFINNGTMKSPVTIPYIDIDEDYFRPFTGVVLVSNTEADVYTGKNWRFFSENGEQNTFDFFDNIEIVRKDSDYSGIFDKDDQSLAEKAGNNPLVLKIKRVTKDGGIVVTDKQLSLIRKIAKDPRNQLSGGILIAFAKSRSQ